MNRYSLVPAACIPAAIVLYFVVIALPVESHNAWGGVAFAGLLAVVTGTASAVLARRHR